MQTASISIQQFPPLELVNKPNVDTAHAAYLLTRRPQTLRAWACLENGPLRPVRINGRLAWPVTEINRPPYRRGGYRLPHWRANMQNLKKRIEQLEALGFAHELDTLTDEELDDLQSVNCTGANIHD